MKETIKKVACGVALLAFATMPALSADARTRPASSKAPVTATAAAAKPTFEQQLLTFLGVQATGQPSEECGEEDALNRPGHAEDARGSAFNPDGIAGQHYAGEQPQNSKNPKSVSQYDTACAHAQSPL
jgi:hypothetical protein